jgi:type IV secretion system protein trbG family protein
MNKKLKYSVVLSCMISTFLVGSAFAHDTEDGVTYYPSYSDNTANVYNYNKYKQFEINTKVGYVTDVQLRPGEVVQKIASGNTTQWQVDVDIIDGVQHVYIKPMVSGIRTNMIINTDQRSYRFLVNSTDEMEYVVVFNFAELDREAQLKAEAEALAAQQARLDNLKRLQNTHFNTNYKVIKTKNVKTVYVPKNIFDDGQKTYIEVSDLALRDNLPLVYSYDDWEKGKLQLVNYRLKNNVIEIDKVVNKMRVMFSQNSYFDVQNKNTEYKNTSPGNIQFKGQPATTLYNADTVNPTEQVSYHDTFVSLNERNRQARMQEYKDLQGGSMDKLDDLINQVEDSIKTDAKSLNPNAQQAQQDNDPKVQQFIQTTYGGSK